MNLLLIDDHELFRSGIKLLLTDLASDIRFAEASSCAQALVLANQSTFDVVLLDFHLPDTRGLDALVALRDKLPGAVIVVLSADEDPVLVRSCIDHGAAGFIPKTSSHSVMMAALRLVLAGGIYLPPHAFHASNGGNLAHAAARKPDGGALAGLTQRQLDTLRLATHGKANKVIARELQISEATVKAHLSAAFRALGVHNRTEAVFVAARLGGTL